MTSNTRPVSAPTRGDTPTLEDAHAVEVLDRVLKRTYLPPYLPGEPPGMAASMVAPHVSTYLERKLQQAYGNPRDGPPSLRKLITRVLPLWKAPLTVEANLEPDGNRLTLTSPTCPLAREVELDPRRCGLCQEAQKHLLRQAIDAPRARVRFPEALDRGDPTCRIEVETPPDPTPPEPPNPAEP